MVYRMKLYAVIENVSQKSAMVLQLKKNLNVTKSFLPGSFWMVPLVNLIQIHCWIIFSEAIFLGVGGGCLWQYLETAKSPQGTQVVVLGLLELHKFSMGPVSDSALLGQWAPYLFPSGIPSPDIFVYFLHFGHNLFWKLFMEPYTGYTEGFILFSDPPCLGFQLLNHLLHPYISWWDCHGIYFMVIR